ncbi:glycosyltransferase [Campylobacter sputorum]|uniref:glycosyltransferase n=1 Tax=Campylobacter sputorum TaxID=206 RepID=UPI00068DEE1E|nr:glycosyltransferase [Campylobacter sputorum]
MVSIIVLVYQEKNLNRFLKQFENLKGEFELIIVSGDKQNYDTLSFELFRCKKGRAVQMNYGVKHAKFDIIWFLHADSKIEKNSILEIENFLKTNLLGAFK